MTWTWYALPSNQQKEYFATSTYITAHAVKDTVFLFLLRVSWHLLLS